MPFAIAYVISLFGRVIVQQGARSSSHKQDDQDDQQDGAKSATDIWAADVEATTPEQDQQNDDEEYRVHAFCPPGNDYEA
jgi:hypothetical protein